MKFLKPLAVLALPFTLLLPATSNAAIAFPALDIQDITGNGDTGVTLTSSTLKIDSTVFTIILDSSSNFHNIPDQNFSLNATPNTSGTDYSGSFTVAGGLLSGSFSNLVYNAPDPTFGIGDISADLTYTGGSMQGSRQGGRLEFAVDSSNHIAGKLGQVNVVPVPAALWLFGSGLLGLVGIARRRTA